MPSVKVDLDNLPKGTLVEVPYLGGFENGTTTEVDEDRWNTFRTLSPNGQALPEGTDTYEVSTAAQKEATEAHKDRTEAAGLTADELEDEHKKDDLIRLAESMGITTAGKNKDELAEDIANAHPEQPQSFPTPVDSEQEEE